MKKNIIIIIFVLTITSFFGVYSSQKKQLSISNITPDSSVSQTNNQFKEINYSTLEKDRLYTEDEGKYENLSDAGKKLLRTVLELPDCINDPTLSYCYEYEQYTIPNSSIVAFKDGVLLIDVPNGKGGASYNVYDIKQEEMLTDSVSHFGTKIRNDKFIVVVNNPNKFINKTTQNLSYYKSGMTKFEPIPLSDIPSTTESYWYYGGMGSEILEYSFKNNVLDITIFNKREGEIGITIPKELRNATFNLNSIQ